MIIAAILTVALAATLLVMFGKSSKLILTAWFVALIAGGFLFQHHVSSSLELNF